MTPRRSLLAAASAALALGALTGCEKPAPIVTIVNAGESTYKQANAFCFEGQSFAANDCAERDTSIGKLEVMGGEVVGVDVSKEVVERGWFIELSDPSDPDAEPQTSEVQDAHFFTFTAPNLPQGSSLALTVRTLAEEGEADLTSGEWLFELSPR